MRHVVLNEMSVELSRRGEAQLTARPTAEVVHLRETLDEVRGMRSAIGANNEDMARASENDMGCTHPVEKVGDACHRGWQLGQIFFRLGVSSIHPRESTLALS
jgi:hypothetical protein